MDSADSAPASSGPSGGGHIASVRSRCGVHAVSWSVDRLASTLARWRKVCVAFFQAVMCSVCGTALLGGSSHSGWTVRRQPVMFMPAGLGNTFVADMTRSIDGCWLCASCSNHKFHGQFLVTHSPTLQRQILCNDPSTLRKATQNPHNSLQRFQSKTLLPGTLPTLF